MSIGTYIPDSNKIIHTTSVDFIKRYINDPVHLVQYDNSTPIIAIQLYSNGTPYVIPSGYDANVRVKKPDGTIIYNPVLGCDAARQIVYVEATTQMCAVDGEIYPIIEINQNGGGTGAAEIAASGYFHVFVDKNPVQDADISSTSEAKAIQDYVTLAESWARGETGFREGEDTDNSKYYAEQSAGRLADATVEADRAEAEANRSKSEADRAESEADRAKSEADRGAADASAQVALAKAEADRAETYKNNAYTYADNANTSANDALTQANNARAYAGNALVSETNASASATDAKNEADRADDNATLAESWAVGGTGTRTGEDTDNAKFWANRAQAVSGLHIATTSLAGIVKPDGTTITVDPDGTIHGGASKSDNKTIVVNADGELAVPIDERTIYVGPDGKVHAAGGGAANIEDITKAEYESRKAAGTLDREKYYAIVDDTEEGGGGAEGKGLIPITKADYEALIEEHPDQMLGKTYQILDDYEEPNIASETEFGFVKLSDRDDVLIKNGTALPATEKNPDVPGSLANVMSTKLSMLDESADWLKSRNLYSQSQIEYDCAYLSDGTVYKGSSWSIAHVPIHGLNKISISGMDISETVAAWANTPIMWEDVNKNPLSQVGRVGNYDNLSVPSNAYFIGIDLIYDSSLTSYYGDINTLQVEEGSVATPYKPYNKSNVELTKGLTWKTAFSNSNVGTNINENLPADFSELLISIDSNDGLRCWSIHLIKEQLKDTSKFYRLGYALGTPASLSSVSDCYVEIQRTKIVRFLSRVDNGNLASTLTVYYR